MIYQQIIAVLKTLDYGNAIRYASANAFELAYMYEQGSTIDELVQICLRHK